MSDDPYLYPGTSILKNKLGLTDPARLDAAQDEEQFNILMVSRDAKHRVSNHANSYAL